MSPITFCLVTQVLSITLATPLPASLTCPIQTGPAATPQHGIWIATPEHNHFFDSPAEMRRRLLAMRQRGINTVFISMWNQGSTLYPSAVMQALTGMPSTAGYNPCTVALYAAEHGGKTPPA